MILKKERSLKNKLFSTKVSFVAFGKRDVQGAIDKPTALEEQQIIDDFGAPVVSVGGYFAAIAKVDANKVTLIKDTVDPTKVKFYATPDELKTYIKDIGLNVGEVAVSFVINSQELNLDSTFATSVTVDAAKEKDEENMTAEQIAEAKCLIFEELIKDRTEKAIVEYKAKLTDFETGLTDANSEEFEIPVV